MPVSQNSSTQSFSIGWFCYAKQSFRAHTYWHSQDATLPTFSVLSHDHQPFYTFVRSCVCFRPKSQHPSTSIDRQMDALYQAPLTITTDGGAQFESALCLKLSRFLDINRIRTSPYYPQLNETIEQTHWKLKAAFVCDLEVPWLDLLPFFCLAFEQLTRRIYKHHLTKCSMNAYFEFQMISSPSRAIQTPIHLRLFRISAVLHALWKQLQLQGIRQDTRLLYTRILEHTLTVSKEWILSESLCSRPTLVLIGLFNATTIGPTSSR